MSRVPVSVQARDAALVARIAALEQRVAKLEASRARRSQRRDARLLAAIEEAVGEHVFTGAELLAHVQAVNPELAGVLTRAGVHSPAQLGKRLQRMHGRDLAGLRLERLGVAHGGCQWVVKVVPAL